MSNMIGIGPFITIPLLMSALGGPQAMLGWVVALVLVAADGMVWSELGAALPGSGGSFRYLVEGYGSATWGRLVGFLFIWQFILSGPLEIASGYIGFAKYAGYIWTGLTSRGGLAIAAGVGILNMALLYRRITTAARGITRRGVVMARREDQEPPAHLLQLTLGLHRVGEANQLGDLTVNP